MNKHLALSLATAMLMAATGSTVAAQLTGSSQASHYPWSDTKLSPDQRANLVIKEMTLQEKGALLHGGGMSFAEVNVESNGGAGYTEAIPRLGIPSIQMADSAYGVAAGAKKGRYSTALPSNLGAASTWDPNTLFEYGALIGRELRDQGYSMSLGGGVNLAREPRDGRTFEYQGEDPLLAGTLVGSFVRGIQSQHVIGTLKHYAMNDQESGRDAVDVNADKRSMRETDLFAFQVALSISNPGGVMCSYNRVNGDYACENSYLLSEVLKKDFQFKGFVFSDWGGTHSTVKASHAGLDMEQPSDYFYGDKLTQAVNAGEVPLEELNDHVHRILRSIFAAGLFDHPMQTAVPDVAGGARLAQDIAERSIVLLKDQDSILPLRHGASIALIGGHADVAMLSGGGSAQVDAPGGSPIPPPPPPPNDFMASIIRPQWLPSSPLHALSVALPGSKVTYSSGDDLLAAAAAARQADIAIVFAYQWEAESFDLPSLALASEQNRLIEAVAAANQRTIVVLETGGPVTMPWIDKVPAVIEAWYPGIRGAEALSSVLTGVVNPSGKLAITFPRSDADLPHPKLVLPPPASKPDYASAKTPADFTRINALGLPPFAISYDENLKVGYKWYDAEKKPVLFPLGFGLSYTRYAYSDLSILPGESTTISFTIKNTGERTGSEIAEVYASLPDSAGEPPKRLIGWSKIELAAGESKEVSIPINRDRLTVYDVATNSWKLVPGKYTIQVGGSSLDLPLRQAVSF